MTIFQKEKESVDFITEGLGIININRFSYDINNSRTIEELTALDIFSHFPVVERGQANQILFDALPLNGIASIEFVLNHVTGTESNFCGVLDMFQQIPNVSIVDGNLIRDPDISNWFAPPWSCNVSKFSVHTNILLGDVQQGQPSLRVRGTISTRLTNTAGRLDSPLFTSFDSGESTDGCFGQIGSVVAGVGEQGDIPIGSPGTMFIENTLPCPGALNIGPSIINESFEKDCVIFWVNVRAVHRTKTYRFRMILQYE